MPLPRPPAALLCFGAARSWYRDTIISPGEVFCSPQSPDLFAGESALSLRTPAGPFDIQELLRRLPHAQRSPHLCLVRIDATPGCLPCNLASLHCPRILIIGDTHHTTAPLRNISHYARSEPFDLIIVEFNRNHIHFFQEAGLTVHWLPHFTLSPFEFPIPPTRQPSVVFAGSIGPNHPLRADQLRALHDQAIPIQLFQGDRQATARVHNAALISLNLPLNGDLNLRTFETLAAGGFLLTQRLAPQSGLYDLLTPGVHFAEFSSTDDLPEQIRHYLRHPELTLEIAGAGQQQYLRHHRPATRIAQLLDLLDGHPPPFPLPPLPRDPDIERRMAIYERLQEFHRTELAPSAWFLPSVDPRVAADAADLPRMQRYGSPSTPQSPDASPWSTQPRP